VLQKIFNKDIVLSVILKSAKNLIFEKRDPSVLGFRLTDKNKLISVYIAQLAGIVESSHSN